MTPINGRMVGLSEIPDTPEYRILRDNMVFNGMTYVLLRPDGTYAPPWEARFDWLDPPKPFWRRAIFLRHLFRAIDWLMNF